MYNEAVEVVTQSKLTVMEIVWRNLEIPVICFD